MDWNDYTALDLLPRSRKVAVGHHSLQVTLDRVIEGTLGVAKTELASLQPELALSTLAALYRFAVLHGSVLVRVDSRAVVELKMDLRLPGDVSLASILEESKKYRVELDLIIGVPSILPRALDPVRGTVVDYTYDQIRLGTAQGDVLIDRKVVQAAAPSADATDLAVACPLPRG